MAINTTTRQTTAFTSGNNFSFGFKVYEVGDVKVIQIQTSNGAETVLTITTHYTVTLNDDQNANPGGTVTLVSSGSPQNLASGYNIVITSKVSPLQQTEITNQGGFFPEVINDVFDKAAILDQQQQNILDKTIRFPLTQTVGGLEITENAANRANKIVQFDGNGDLIISGTVDGRDVSADGAKLDTIESGATGDQTVGEIKALIAGSPLDASHLAADSVTGSELAANSVDSSELVDGSIDTQHIGNEQVATSKIAPDAINSTKIQDNAIDSEHYVDGSIDRVHLEADIIDSSKLADNSVNSEHYVDGSIDHVHLANDIVDGDNIADNSINSEHYVDGSIDHEHLANDIINSDNIQDDVVNSEHIVAGAIDNEHYAAGSITVDKLDGATVVTASEQSSAASNDTSFLTVAAADARFFNVSTGDTIKDGDTFPDNDTTIATTAAINDRIIDLVDDVGGFVPIANETSFPTANPDAENGTGTVVSVKAASTNLTPSGTTVTIANGAGTGNTVTITGVPSVIPSGFGFLVETTSTLHTYTFHRLVPKATEVTTVAGKSVEIGRLGTADAVADMAILGTTDVVADMNMLATSDVVADMALLATTDVIADMALLGVSSVISDMDTLADIAGNIQTVAGISSNVTTVAGISSQVSAVASDATDIGLVAGSITNVNNVAGSITNVNAVANNLSNVNAFANQYRIGSTNPTTSLDVGDLFFNTTTNSLKVYTGSAWVDGVTQTGNFALLTGNTFTGDNIFNDNAKIKLGTGSDFEIYHNGSDTIFDDVGTGTLKLQLGGATKLEIQSGGIGITGNIVVSGNVDGRDLAADGTKLDGITSGAIADIVQDTSPQLGGTLDTNNQNIHFNDNVSARFGTGQDFDIYHDGTNSRLNSASHNLNVRTPRFGVYDGAGNETMLLANANGAVELYHNNVKKFETVSGGVDVDGSVTADDIITAGALLHEGDTDTLVHFSAANTIQLKTGGSSRFLINNSGTSLENGNLNVNGNRILIGDSSGSTDDRIAFGESQDLQIYHDGTNSVITNATGDLYINNNNDIIIKPANDLFIKPQDGESGISVIGNGAVELYYDNVKVFHTKENGIIVEGTEGQGAILEFRADQGDDNADRFRFYADPTNSDLYLQNYRSGSWETNARFSGNGAAELWYDNVRMFYTDANGVKVGDGKRYIVGDDADGYLRYISNTVELYVAHAQPFKVNLGGETAILATANGAVELYHNNSKKFETHPNGVLVTGNIYAGDNEKILLGNNADLEIYHDGSHNRIDSINGNIYLRHGTDNAIRTIPNGAVSLYYDDSEKLATSNAGVEITGKLFVDGIDMDDNEKILLGTSDDFEIVHTGSGSYLKDVGTGNLELWSNTLVFRNAAGNEVMAAFLEDGTAKLYYNNVQTFETTSSGCTLTGNLAITGTVDGRDVASDGSKLDTYAANGSSYLRSDQADTATGLLTLSGGIAVSGRVSAPNINSLNGGTITIDFTASNHHAINLNQNSTLTHTGTANTIGQSGSIFITHSGNGRTMSFNSGYKFAGGVTPVLSTTSGAVDRLDYVVKASNVIHAVVTLDVKAGS